MKRRLMLGIGVYALLILVLFKNVVSLATIAGGDYIPLWPSHVEYFSKFALSSWDPNINLGWSAVGLLHTSPFSYFIGITGSVIKNTGVVERLVWWIPFLILSTFSISFLFVRLFPKNSVWVVSPLIFLCNTYILMLIGGGQIAGVGLAYALAPLVFLKGIQLTDAEQKSLSTLRNSLLLGLLLSVQVMFDLRVTYITLLGVGLYFLFSLIFSFKTWKNILWVFIIPGVLTFLLHAFWLLPMALFRENPITQFGTGYTTGEAVKFFSFAKFEHTLSLLHPNWPENIFGKVDFMKPEFLLLPILAYSSLLFVASKVRKHAEQRRILFFVLLGLLGAFLAKGANEPFGDVYLWLFDTVPGFVMFRDSTKWYLLTAISYAVLIPFSILKIYEWISSKREFQISNFKFPINTKNRILNTQNLFLLLTSFILLLLLRPVFLGQLTGTFRHIEMPQEYEKLNQYLNADSSYGRTLWVPSVSRFADYKLNHPVVFGTDFFNAASPSGVVEELKDSEELLQESAIEYIIVPYDPLGELFITDRKYDGTKYRNTIAALETIPWLQKVEEFEKIGVFKVVSAKSHFWSADVNTQLSYELVSPTHYKVQVTNASAGEKIVFAEAYDSKWMADTGSTKIPSERYNQQLNSFVVPRDGDNLLHITYLPQTLVNKGIMISMLTLVVTISVLVYLQVRSRHS